MLNVTRSHHDLVLQYLLDEASDLSSKLNEPQSKKLDSAAFERGRGVGFIEGQRLAYAAVPAVHDGALEEMRGGIRLGDGIDIAVGLTRTGSINGVEQYSNTLQIDDLTSGMDGMDLSSMQGMVIQNGAGNNVAAGIADSLSGNFSSVIQNSLDNQVIWTMTIYDVSLKNVSSAIGSISAQEAIAESLSFNY